MSKEAIKNYVKAAEELNMAVGKVIRYEFLSGLEKAIADLNLKQIAYMKEYDKLLKSTCGSCALPCGEDWCVTNGESNEKND